MSQPYTSEPTERELAAELQAAVAARQELGADMQDAVIDAFLARLQQRIDMQVAEQVQQHLPKKTGKKSDGPPPVSVVAPSLALAIPLIAIAGGIAGGPGIFFVMAGVVLINLVYFIDRWT